MTALYKRQVLCAFAVAMHKGHDHVEMPRWAIQRAWPGAACVQAMLSEPGMRGWKIDDTIGATERELVYIFRYSDPLPRKGLSPPKRKKITAENGSYRS